MGSMNHHCEVCKRKDRRELDKRILDPRTSLTSLGTEIGISRKTLAKHRDKHIAPGVAQALIIQRELGDRIEPLHDVHELARLYTRTQSLLADAESKGELRTALVGIRECARLIELAFSFAERASHHVDVARDPRWQRLQYTIIRSLEAYPEARRAVLDAILRELPPAHGGVSENPDARESLGRNMPSSTRYKPGTLTAEYTESHE